MAEHSYIYDAEIERKRRLRISGAILDGQAKTSMHTKEIAEKSGISENIIKSYIYGRVQMANYIQVKRICDALGLNASEVWGD